MRYLSSSSHLLHWLEEKNDLPVSELLSLALYQSVTNHVDSSDYLLTGEQICLPIDDMSLTSLMKTSTNVHRIF